MKEKDYKKAIVEKKVEHVKDEPTSQQDKSSQSPLLPDDIKPFLTTLFQIRQLKKTVSTAPTRIPKTFFEQFEFYKNGATYRLYIYVSNSWRYVALT